MTDTPLEFPFVADTSTLREVTARLGGNSLVAIDTEFIRERTYFPELCVLQIATDEVLAAIDCLADIDLEPVFSALFAESRPWLLHSARQDLEVLFNRTGRLPAGLVDTQVAAAMLGHPLQIGLKGLLEEVLGVAIGKEHTRADWSRRPLPDEVLGYALDDVRYLLPAWRELTARLDAADRLDWFKEDCARLLAQPLQPPAEAILERTRGAGGLRGRQRAAALALVGWRETRAIARDKPRRWILDDDPLVRIAQALPDSTGALQRVAGLPAKLVDRSGAAIVTAVGKAEPAAERAEPVAPDKSRVKALQAEVKRRAEALGIKPELLATRRDIALAAGGQMPDSFAAGWRGEILGDLTG